MTNSICCGSITINKGERIMENILINKLNEKDVEHCTTNFGLKLRRKEIKEKLDELFK